MALPTEPLRAEAARRAGGRRGRTRVGDLGLPRATARVHAQWCTGGARRRPVRPHAGADPTRPLLSGSDARHARDARLRRRRQPLGCRDRRAVDQRAQLVSRRRGEQRRRRVPPHAPERDAPRHARRSDGARADPPPVGADGRTRVRRLAAMNVCVAGAGTIGSLLAAHLGRVTDVSVLVRREEHAHALNTEGLRVSGRSDFTARVTAATNAADLPLPDLVIVACKGNDLARVAESLRGEFDGATVMTIQNGLGAEEVVAACGDWPLLSSVTFMSGTRRSDAHVEYILDTETWIGPNRATTPADARLVADLLNTSGLKAQSFDDLRPAQWSKLIFNATVNGVAALTGLPHDAHFAEEPLGPF